MKSTPVSAIGADGVERDAAGGLELGPAGDERDGRAELVGRHVVEQDPVGARVERLRDLVERVALDLDREAGSPRAGDRFADRAGERAGGCP